MEYPLIITASVSIIYALGIVGILGILAKVSVWTFEKILIVLRVRRAFVDFLNDRRKPKVYTPKMTRSPFKKEDE